VTLEIRARPVALSLLLALSARTDSEPRWTEARGVPWVYAERLFSLRFEAEAASPAGVLGLQARRNEGPSSSGDGPTEPR
jgi:hypothetical protein